MVVLVGGYYGLDYVKVHNSADVNAYKRFAKALVSNDLYTARQAGNKELVADVFAVHDERRKRYAGTRVLFTYYNVLSQTTTADGASSTIIAEQVSRVDSAGRPGFWGDREIRVRHTAKLEYDNFVWRVVAFQDPAMR